MAANYAEFTTAIACNFYLMLAMSCGEVMDQSTIFTFHCRKEEIEWQQLTPTSTVHKIIAQSSGGFIWQFINNS